MKANDLFEQILVAGQELAEQGKTYAQTKLDLPPAGPERDAALASMGKGAAIAGVLGLLLGTKSGRKITGSGLKLGSLAALAGVVYKTYQNWQGQHTDDTVSAIEAPKHLTEKQAEQRSLILLKTMIAAAKADGHIDAEESAKIKKMIDKLDVDQTTAELLKTTLATQLDAKDIAALAENNPELGAEIYMTSLLVTNQDNELERIYLGQLAQHLNIPNELAMQLKDQIDSSV